MPTELHRGPASKNLFYDSSGPTPFSLAESRQASDLAQIATRNFPFASSELIDDRDTLLDRAHTMLDTLDKKIGTVKRRLKRDGKENRQSKVLFDLSDGDNIIDDISFLKQVGFDTDPGWAEAIIEAALRDKPIDLEAAHFSVKSMTNVLGEKYLDYPALRVDQIYPAAIVSALQEVLPTQNIKKKIIVDDYRDPITEVLTTQSQRDLATTETKAGMERYGIIQTDSVPGVDHTIVRTSDQIDKAEKLIAALTELDNGIIVEKDNKLIFKPNDQLIDALGTMSDEQRVQLQRDGIVLQDGYYPSPSLLRAAAYFESDDTSMHVALVDEENSQLYSQAYTILRAAERATRDQHHSITYRKDLNYPELITLEVLSALYAQTKKVLNYLEKDTNFSDMPADFGYTYVNENYGRKVEGQGYPHDILPTDVKLAYFFLDHIDEIVPEGGFENYVNSGRGPFSYLDQIFARHVRGPMYWDEPFHYMRDVATQEKAGTLPSEYNVGPKFEKMLAAHRRKGRFYKGSHDLARKKAEIRDQRMEDLAEDSITFQGESFVTCSKARTKTDFWSSIRQKARAAKKNNMTWEQDKKDKTWKKVSKSRIVALHMVGSKGWDGLPAVDLSLDDIKQAYLDAGLEITHFYPVMNTKTDGTTRPGYDGMVAVVARPKN